MLFLKGERVMRSEEKLEHKMYLLQVSEVVWLPCDISEICLSKK